MDEVAYKEDFNNIDKTPKLVKPPEKTSGNYYCPCSVCELQRKERFDAISINQAKEDFANYEGREKSFSWLLKEFGKASKENSVKLNIPETVVFRKSKPSFLIYQKTDRTIKMTTSAKKLKLAELKKLLTSTARQRKREEHPAIKVVKPESYGKEVALVRYMYRDFDNEASFIPPSHENGALRVMVYSEFSKLMVERAGSSI